jgi:phage recombination protein Bet
MADQSLVKVDAPPEFTSDQVNVIKQHLAPGISDEELHLFAMVCRRTGLDPFTRQIYAVMRNVSEKQGERWVTRPKMTIQTGIDGYRLIAARTGELAGIDDAEYDTEDAEHPMWARVTVYRLVQGQRCPFTAKARWSEYVQLDTKSTPTRMWQRMPYLMLGKCAEALALRKAFPAELSGIYTSEEMEQADNPDEVRTAKASAAGKKPDKYSKYNTDTGPYTAIGRLIDWCKDNGIDRSIISDYYDANNLPRNVEGAERIEQDLKNPAIEAMVRVHNWARQQQPPIDLRAIDGFIDDEHLSGYLDLWQRIQKDDRQAGDIVAALQQRNVAYIHHAR